MYKVSFTGHRPEKLPFFSEDDPMLADLKNRLKIQSEKVINEGSDCFFSGMARGVDLWCAEIVIELKQKYPQIKLTAVIPCKSQSSKWSTEDKKRYETVLKQCDKVVYTSESYSQNCMLKRDRALVELCDILVAVFDGSNGGTKYTVDYAGKMHRKVILVPVI